MIFYIVSVYFFIHYKNVFIAFFFLFFVRFPFFSLISFFFIIYELRFFLQNKSVIVRKRPFPLVDSLRAFVVFCILTPARAGIILPCNVAELGKYAAWADESKFKK